MDYAGKANSVIVPEHATASESTRPVPGWLVPFAVLVIASLLVACYLPMLQFTGHTPHLSAMIWHMVFA